MFPVNAFVTDLVIFIAFFTAYVLITIRWKPRIWLHDFPVDIQAMAGPKTDEEKRLTTLIGAPLVILFFGLPILLLWDLKVTLGADFSFLSAWLYAYALFISFNLWDLVVLDWGGISLIDPQNPPIAGTAGAAGWRNYAFHFHGFLKGCVIGLFFATFVAGIITLFA